MATIHSCCRALCFSAFDVILLPPNENGSNETLRHFPLLPLSHEGLPAALFDGYSHSKGWRSCPYVHPHPVLFASSSIPKQYFSHHVNDISDGSPSRICSVRRISFGITIRPRSSMRRTIPVAFIFTSHFSPPLLAWKRRFLSQFACDDILCFQWEIYSPDIDKRSDKKFLFQINLVRHVALFNFLHQPAQQTHIFGAASHAAMAVSDQRRVNNLAKNDVWICNIGDAAA